MIAEQASWVGGANLTGFFRRIHVRNPAPTPELGPHTKCRSRFVAYCISRLGGTLGCGVARILAGITGHHRGPFDGAGVGVDHSRGT